MSLEHAPYTLRHVQQMLGLSRTVISGLVAAGFVSPQRGPRREHRFTFQDLMLLRTAHGLQSAKIPPRRIVRSLLKLRADLPEELPLTGLRITAIGADVAVRDRQGRWQADSGQLLMDFEVAAVEGVVAFLEPRSARPAQAPHADGQPQDWLAQGVALEATDPAAAEAAYRRALAAAPDLVDAYLNLGALLSERHRSDEALRLYDDALTRCGPSPLLLFNRGIALEDQGRLQDAAEAYEHCLRVDPTLADAHFNLGRLREQLGDSLAALRHFSSYRRLSRGAAD